MAAEDASQLLEIEGLREEAFTARTEAGFNRASDELLRRADAAASSPEDRLLRAIEWELLRDPAQYRATLDVCDGNERVAAGLVLDHMVQLLRRGRAWPMVKSMATSTRSARWSSGATRRSRPASRTWRGGELRAAGAQVIDLTE